MSCHACCHTVLSPFDANTALSNPSTARTTWSYRTNCGPAASNLSVMYKVQFCDVQQQSMQAHCQKPSERLSKTHEPDSRSGSLLPSCASCPHAWRTLTEQQHSQRETQNKNPSLRTSSHTQWPAPPTTCACTEARTKTPAALHPDKHTTWCVLRCGVTKPDHAPHPLSASLQHTRYKLQALGPIHFLAAVATASFFSFASNFCFLLGVMPDFFVPSRVSAAAAAAAPVAAAGVKQLSHTEA